MQTIPTYNVGPHMYQVSTAPSYYRILYRLWGAIGWQRGRAYNAGDWIPSRHTFPFGSDGLAKAHAYAQQLLRPQDQSND